MTIDFYFDFGSPASYLAWTQIGRIERESGAEVALKPMLLGGVFKATGNASPVVIPAKGAWLLADLGRWAARYGAPLNMPPNFPINTLSFMRSAVALGDDPRRGDYVRAVFEAIFADGRAMDDPAIVGAALAAAGFDAGAVIAAASDAAVKEKLKTETEAAVARGVFGAPTFFLGDEMHFGQDRIDWVIEAAKRERLK